MNNIRPIKEAAGWDTDANGKKWEDYDEIVCPNGQVIDMVKLLDEQQRAKAALIHILPFFRGFVNKLRPVYTFRVPTQATDGYSIFINPQFTYNMDLTGKVFVMAHEIMHCVLNHLRRGKSHDPERSNIAADYEVNISLVDMGLVKQSVIEKLKGLIDTKYSGWGYEKIYDSNPSAPNSGDMSNSGESKDAQKNQQSGQGSSGSGGSGKKEMSADYKAGWNQAMEDYKNGKLKL
jgi:predicted metal-dependent peptidase